MGDAANPVNWSVFRPPIWALASSLRPQIARIFAASHEGDAFLILCTGKTCTSGSNPGFSAIFHHAPASDGRRGRVSAGMAEVAGGKAGIRESSLPWI